MSILTLAAFLGLYVESLFLTAYAVSKKAKPQVMQSQHTNERELSRTLEEIEKKLGKLGEKLEKGQDAGLKKKDLQSFQKTEDHPGEYYGIALNAQKGSGYC